MNKRIIIQLIWVGVLLFAWVDAVGDINLQGFATSSTNGLVFYGESANDVLGASVQNAGDINGDGIADMIMGAPQASYNVSYTDIRSKCGVTYVIFGNRTGVDFSTLTSENKGFKIFGAVTQDESGFSVSSVGDFNGDSLDDIIIGARSADPQGRLNAGAAYVIFGHNASIPFVDIDLAHLINSTMGFAVLGADPGGNTGYSVSGAGDINGDGLADVVIGAPYANGGDGKSYVFVWQPHCRYS